MGQAGKRGSREAGKEEGSKQASNQPQVRIEKQKNLSAPKDLFFFAILTQGWPRSLAPLSLCLLSSPAAAWRAEGSERHGQASKQASKQASNQPQVRIAKKKNLSAPKGFFFFAILTRGWPCSLATLSLCLLSSPAAAWRAEG